MKIVAAVLVDPWHIDGHDWTNFGKDETFVPQSSKAVRTTIIRV
jgi:hypothetical protein